MHGNDSFLGLEKICPRGCKNSLHGYKTAKSSFVLYSEEMAWRIDKSVSVKEIDLSFLIKTEIVERDYADGKEKNYRFTENQKN